MQQPDFATDSDIDLYRLQNTWHFGESVGPSPVVVETPSVARPRTLFVGSSFTWLFIDVLRPLVRDPHFFYYNSSIYDVSSPQPILEGPVDPSAASWESDAGDEDLYVLEILEAYAQGPTAGDFLRALRDRLQR